MDGQVFFIPAVLVYRAVNNIPLMQMLTLCFGVCACVYVQFVRLSVTDSELQQEKKYILDYEIYFNKNTFFFIIGSASQ